MALRKYGKGRIIRSKDEEREKKIAAMNFTEEDRKQLERELLEDTLADDDDSR